MKYLASTSKKSDLVSVERLRYILFFVIPSAVFYILSFFYNILLYLVIIAALLFIPYLLYVLIKIKRYGWIITFFIFVILPYILILLFLANHKFVNALLLLPISFFYFYCFIIKYSVEDWLEEYRAHEIFEMQRMASQQKIE